MEKPHKKNSYSSFLFIGEEETEGSSLLSWRNTMVTKQSPYALTGNFPQDLLEEKKGTISLITQREVAGDYT